MSSPFATLSDTPASFSPLANGPPYTCRCKDGKSLCHDPRCQEEEPRATIPAVSPDAMIPLCCET